MALAQHLLHFMCAEQYFELSQSGWQYDFCTGDLPWNTHCLCTENTIFCVPRHFTSLSECKRIVGK